MQDGTHRLAEPVSKTTLKVCAGVPMLISPKYWVWKKQSTGGVLAWGARLALQISVLELVGKERREIWGGNKPLFREGLTSR